MDALTIHEAAETTGWSPRMLRYIERVGLIEPERTTGGYRLFGPAQLQRLRTLRELLSEHDVALSDMAFARRLREEDQELRDRYGPPGDYDPQQFASGNVYYSGALLLMELRERLGAEVFDRLLRQWPQEHRYGSVDRDSYEAWVEQKTGKEVSRFLDRWLTSRTTPR